MPSLADRTVGIDVSKALGPFDGLARYTAGLVRALAKLEVGLPPKERLRARLFPIYQQATDEAEALALERLGELPDGFELVNRRVPEPPEISLLHCTSHSVPSSWCGPLVFTVYDLSFLALPEAHTLHNRAHCSVGLARALARQAQLAAISEHTRGELGARLHVSSERVAVVPPGVEGRFEPLKEAAVRITRGRYDLPERFVLSVGTREPRKNLRSLVAAYRQLPAELRTGCPLVLVGAAGWGDALSGAEVAPNEVIQLGGVDDDDLPMLYACATVFAYPSLYEGFGLPVLEAMACGVPVLVGNRSSLPEVVGDAGFKVDVTDPGAIAAGLERLLSDSELAGRLGRAGTSRARLFTWQSTAELMHELYCRVLGGSARAW